MINFTLKLQNVTNANLRSSALIFSPSFDHKYESSLKITSSRKGPQKFSKTHFSRTAYYKFSKIHFSRTAYYNFDLWRLLSLFQLTLQMTIRLRVKIWFLRKSLLRLLAKNDIYFLQRNSIASFEILNPGSVRVKLIGGSFFLKF